ncbi:GDSL-type esterase/lipase family protein [Leptothoe sp. PORK10 BA2]|uniref:GDSL-type esterase/lipase family protein n=1 Tax=Leptothoe sp. PORK10 BA2 TaxID=3110254 RepID=UPI002B2074B7|nr:GDSL-type esterase/lipase family protein [Leptothoe sp. PORK10 BA2]MEA5462729.1 GDSL-type esterase/lipase family protein [Leptothoe sp. PORK10 BA2]
MSDLLMLMAQLAATEPLSGPNPDVDIAPMAKAAVNAASQIEQSVPLPTIQGDMALTPEFSREVAARRQKLLHLQNTARRPEPTAFATTPHALEVALRQPAPVVAGPKPISGPQLFEQRWAALQSGSLYTRISPESFHGQWAHATYQPTYGEWQGLLKQEADAIASGQGTNRLTVVVGDSLSMWLPPEMLPRDRFWLNQGISGDTTGGILQRLSAFANTNPDTIHLMAGVNDLKNGASDREILTNLNQIMAKLRQQHPTARVVVHSILPTRWENIPSQRIRTLNTQIAQLTDYHQLDYLDLHPSFSNETGNLRQELTTDGLHLNRLGYQVWQLALLAV